MQNLDTSPDREMPEWFTRAGEGATPELFEALSDLFNDDQKSMRDWFDSPCYGLGGESPAQYVQNGRQQDVINLIGRIEWGIFS